MHHRAGLAAISWMDITRNSLPIRLSAFLLLSLVIVACYANTFYASWQLDDKPNIVNNTYLHLNSLAPRKLIQTFYTDHENPGRLRDKLYRPVPSLSFALNWYFGRDHVIGYHIVNTVIHVLTAFVLFVFMLHLFRTPNLKTKVPQNPVFIALLASLLWAVHPIQTQAVTYIVQRMAQLAALFYILGLYAFLKARLSTVTYKRWFWLSSCVFFYLLGVNSKPNAAMLPMALVLVEVVFFQNLANPRTRRHILWAILLVVALILVLGVVFFLNGEPLSFLDLYRNRTFTLSERLMTQPRVVLFYLSQIAFPLPNRFSVAHDVTLSSTWFIPWTTLPSVLTIFFFIGFSIHQMAKRPILAFAILFYFLNQIIESSVIALEMIFEHRNYLPSFFLFLPPTVLLGNILRATYNKNKVVYTLFIGAGIALVSLFSISTIARNQAWKDQTSLWMDAASKAPNHYRPFHVLAVNLAWGDDSHHPRRYDMALELFRDALKKYIPSKNVKADIYGNMALIYFHFKNDPQQAFNYFKKALTVHPGYHKIRREFVEALTINRDFDLALEQVNLLLSKAGDSGRDLNLKGHILLWQNQFKEALLCFRSAYPLLVDKSNLILNSSVALSMAGRYTEAEKLLLSATKLYPDKIPFYAAIIENSLRANTKDQAAVYARQLLERFDLQKIRSDLATFSNNPKFAPLGEIAILPVIEEMASEETDIH